MSPIDFAKALAFALKWEVGNAPNGGYLSPARAAQLGDPGGETKYGISKRSYPHLDIAGLTLDAAKAIYEYDYWQATGNQEGFCSEMHWPLDAVHFDCVVNVGNRKVAKDGTVVMHRRANMILQRALGVDDDGYIGPVTRRAIEQGDPAEIAKRAILQRDLYYSTLGAWADQFKIGWHNRTNDLRRTFLSAATASEAV